jgi:DNA polymerase III subunit epsilon
MEMNIAGVNPETDNEFMFYEFICRTPNYLLEPWIQKAKSVGYKIRPNFEQAVSQKLATNSFTNPHTFPEYFQNQFDYIAIDFETANNSRLSACAIGLNFVKNNKVVHSSKHYIQPPPSEKFLKTHIDIHGITKDDVEYAMNFGELWNFEFSKYFTDNLIVFHNASMELSVLKNLFEHYDISPFKISYIDTMLFADKLGYSKKLTDLAKTFNIEIKKHHDPESDAETCSLLFGELIDRYSNYKELIRTIDSNTKSENSFQNKASEETLSENEIHKKSYAITFEELQALTIATKGFVVTGNFDIERDIITDFLMRQGGQVKQGISTKVDYVIAGRDCGWVKIQKIDELNNSKKADIKILGDIDLEFLMNKYGT